MEIKLKVLQGSSSGKELLVTGPEFVIGRSDDCNLRPHSDAVSRRHCSISIRDGLAIARDLGSRNGTYVNDQQIEGAVEIKTGDQLRVGPLKFLVIFDQPVLGKAAASETTTGDSGIIGEWLEEADQKAKSTVLDSTETRQFKFKESEKVVAATDPDTTKDVTAAETKPISKTDKSTKDSQEAAAEMLRKFFNRSG